MYTATELSSKTLKELKVIADQLDADPLGHTGRKMAWVEGILEAQSLPADIAQGQDSMMGLQHPELSIEAESREVKETRNAENPNRGWTGSQRDRGWIVRMDGSSEPININKFLESINEKMTENLLIEIFSDSTFGEDIKDLQKWIRDFVKEIPKPFPHFLLLGTDFLQLQKTILQAKAVDNIELHEALQFNIALSEALHNSLAKPADTIIMMIKYWLVDNDQRWDHPVLLRGKNDLCFFEKGGFILGEPAADFGFPKKILCDYLEDSSRQFQFMDSSEFIADCLACMHEGLMQALHKQAEAEQELDPVQSIRNLAEAEDMERKAKTLFLILNKEWFDLIATGQKKEIYREVNPLWEKILSNEYSQVEIMLGEGNRKPAPRLTIPLTGITKGLPNSNGCPPEWYDKECFILKLKIETEIEFLERNLTQWLEDDLREAYWGVGDQDKFWKPGVV